MFDLISPSMLTITVSIITVWAILFCTALLCRRTTGLSRRSRIVIVTAAYLALAGLALSWFGWNSTGLLGITGMLLPWAVGVGIVVTPRRAA